MKSEKTRLDLEKTLTMPADTHSLRVVVNRDKCRGYGICAEICPDVYKLDGQGFAYVEADAPIELEGLVVEACDNCPEEAITVECLES